MTPKSHPKQELMPNFPTFTEAPEERAIVLVPPPAPAPGLALLPPGITGDDARRLEEALESSQAPATLERYRRSYQAFADWCEGRGEAPLPAPPELVSAYIAERAEQGYRKATLGADRAGISDAHRRAQLPDPTANDGFRRVMRGLARRDGRPQTQARGMTAEALAAIRATACAPRPIGGRSPRYESVKAAQRRGLVDVATCALIRDGLLRRSEAAALTWADLSIEDDGTGRIAIRRSKTDQEAEGAVLFVGVQTVKDLLAIRPEAGVAPAALVLGMSSGNLGKRVRAAAIHAGLGDGFTGHSGRVGMAQDLARGGADLPQLMQAGRWTSATMPAHYTAKEFAGRGAVAAWYSKQAP